MQERSARQNEKTIPTHGDHGGPLCCIVAMYEDGTEIQFGHETIHRLQNALREIVEADGTPEAPKHVSRSAIIGIATKALG